MISPADLKRSNAAFWCDSERIVKVAIVGITGEMAQVDVSVDGKVIRKSLKTAFLHPSEKLACEAAIKFFDGKMVQAQKKRDKYLEIFSRLNG